MLKATLIQTPVGPMVAVGDDELLHRLDFQTSSPTNHPIGRTLTTDEIEKELKLYFQGELTAFKTPLFLKGTPFQIAVWHQLNKIPYAKTISYLEEAIAIGHPKGYRAVANANGANPFSIAIPCHRVINANGALGGYGGGLERKIWLLNHEKAMAASRSL